MHVYRMQQLIKERAKDTVVNVAQRNSLYQTIARLLRDEQVVVHETTREENRPERVVYALSDAGRETLDRWLAEMLAVPAREFPEFPAAIAFLVLLPARRVRELLQQRRAEQHRILESTRRGMQEAIEGGLPRLFVLEEEYKCAMLDAEIAWLDQVIADLADRRLSWNRAWLRKVARAMAES